MYGNRATRRQKQKKMKESEVLGKSKDCTLPNNWFKYQIYKKKILGSISPFFFNTDPV